MPIVFKIFFILSSMPPCQSIKNLTENAVFQPNRQKPSTKGVRHMNNAYALHLMIAGHLSMAAFSILYQTPREV